MCSGQIHTNGGKATSTGGGGGGYITISYTNGFVDTRDITSYGGSTSNGENGAAGVIYLAKGNNRKVSAIHGLVFCSFVKRNCEKD